MFLKTFGCTQPQEYSLLTLPSVTAALQFSRTLFFHKGYISPSFTHFMEKSSTIWNLHIRPCSLWWHLSTGNPAWQATVVNSVCQRCCGSLVEMAAGMITHCRKTFLKSFSTVSASCLLKIHPLLFPSNNTCNNTVKNYWGNFLQKVHVHIVHLHIPLTQHTYFWVSGSWVGRQEKHHLGYA